MVEEALANLAETGFAFHDADHRVIWVPNAPRFNKAGSPNHIRAWWNRWCEFPKCDYRYLHLPHLKDNARLDRPSHTDAWNKTFGRLDSDPAAIEALRKPFGSSREGLTKGFKPHIHGPGSQDPELKDKSTNEPSPSEGLIYRVSGSGSGSGSGSIDPESKQTDRPGALSPFRLYHPDNRFLSDEEIMPEDFELPEWGVAECRRCGLDGTDERDVLEAYQSNSDAGAATQAQHMKKIGQWYRRRVAEKQKARTRAGGHREESEGAGGGGLSGDSTPPPREKKNPFIGPGRGPKGAGPLHERTAAYARQQLLGERPKQPDSS
jgi:hypothetical protein